MRNVKIGWWTIWVIALTGAMLWLSVSGSLLSAGGWQNWSRALGQLAGVVGLGWFAWDFVLNTRWKWVEDSFGGLNKVYLAHHWLGGVSFILLLIHPLILAFGRLATSSGYAANLFVPTASNVALTLGQTALVVMQVTLVATFFGRLLYQNWKFLHQWLGLGIVLGALHGLWQGSITRGFSILTVYELLLFAVALLAFSYRTLLGKWLVPKYDYRVKAAKKLNKDILEITLEPAGSAMKYHPGQFVFVQFEDGSIGREFHPFSIVSVGKEVQLAVKISGDFTRRLYNRLRVGTSVKLERAYGEFSKRSFPGFNTVWVAGGIGVAPFIGMAKEVEHWSEVRLIYSARTSADLVYSDSLNEIARARGNFSWLSRISEMDGRLTTEDVLAEVTDLSKTEFFICGPTAMMNDIAKGLARAGVAPERVHTEVFML